MRVLHVNKFVTITGGPERNLCDLVEGLVSAGHTADVFSAEELESVPGTDPRDRSGKSRLRSAASILWSEQARRALHARVVAFRPDVVHMHSIYHQLSASVLHAVPRPIPIVMSLHDYKLAAPCYTLFRNGSPCTLCVGNRFSTSGLRYRCVKNSYAASAICVAEKVLHHRSYRTRVDRYIVPSLFASSIYSAEKLVPEERISVLNHGVTPWTTVEDVSANNDVLFVGRLAPEKSVEDLLEAWSIAALPRAPTLRIVGDGPSRRALERKAGERVSFEGWLDREGIAALAGSARLLVVPSRFLETFGLVAAEALASGLPVVVAESGALPEHVTRSGGGLTYPPGDTAALARALERLGGDDDEVRSRGAKGRTYALANLSIERMVEGALTIYEDVVRASE